MKKILIASCLIACNSAYGMSSSPTTAMPKDFFVENINGASCSADYNRATFYNDLNYINELKYQNDNDIVNSNSLTVNHEELSKRWSKLLGITYGIANNRDHSRAKEVVNVLVDLAQNNTLLDSLTPGETVRAGCWIGGDKNSPCLFHTPQHTGFTMIAMLYSAIVLEEYISPNQKQILDVYFKKSYNKFIKPMAKTQLGQKGLYEFADYGLGVLAYARWTNNAQLAARELKNRRNSFIKKIEEGGFIDNNSFRGNRGYWYHTLGAESALGYALVARSFGYNFFKDPTLGPELKAIADATLLGGIDYNSFDRLPDRGRNASKDPEDAKPHMHQMSVSLPLIIEQEYGINVPTHQRYNKLVQLETIGRFIGFNADCYYESIN
jgi:hypothetical protein